MNSLEKYRENLEDKKFHENKRVTYSGGNSSKSFSTYTKEELEEAINNSKSK